MQSRPVVTYRSKTHLSYWAYLLHRLSGLALALFIPLHFFVLSQSLRGQAGLEQYLHLTEIPIFKIGEWILVMFLTLHLTGGIRLLMIEFGPWRGLRKGSIQLGIILAIACGLVFLYLGSE